jgi:hypothetical protein
MVNLTQGRARGCKDGLGGVKKIYLFKYVKYSKSQIVTDDLVLTSFPATDIYEFYVSNNPSFSNPMQEDKGGKFYNEDISLEFAGIKIYDEFEKFLKFDFRMIILDNNGVYRMLGAYNGIISYSLERVIGNAKADFRGYKASFEGMELQPALFINDLASVGFTIVENDYLLLEDGEFILTENNELIILE